MLDISDIKGSIITMLYDYFIPIIYIIIPILILSIMIIIYLLRIEKSKYDDNDNK